MTKAGLNTIESLNIAKESFNNLYLRLELDVIENRVISGSSLSQSFSESKVFPRVFVQLLISGDMGGKVSEMFEKIKNYLDQEVESVRNIMLTFLQPSIILVMGVFVLLIVLSIMLPLLQMNNLIFNL
jgi:general secretion pathway protein F